MAPPPSACVVTTTNTPQLAPLHPLPESDHASVVLGFEPATGVSVAEVCFEGSARSRKFVSKDRPGSAPLSSLSRELAGFAARCSCHLRRVCRRRPGKTLPPNSSGRTDSAGHCC